MLLYYTDDSILSIDSIPLSKTRRVEELHKELYRLTIKQSHFWLVSKDSFLFVAFREFYEALSDEIGVKRVEDLLPKYRHQFFIATDPVAVGDRTLPGLSGIQKLLGYSYSTNAKPKKKTNAIPVADLSMVTTGDQVLDTFTALHLAFGDSATWIADNFGLPDCNKLIEHLYDRRDTESALKRIQTRIDKQYFEKFLEEQHDFSQYSR